MPLFNMPQLRAQLAPDSRLLGLDLGSRVIGVALSDVSLMLASPYATLRRGKMSGTAADIAAIPFGGKFRVRKCTVIKELDLVELGLVEKPAKPKRVRKPKVAA